jgi:hypothetical protein
MIRVTALIGLSLAIFDSSAFAQSADPSEGLEACFRRGRLADKFCEGQTDPQARSDCYKKNRDAQLECLTRVFPDQPIASTPPQKPPPASPATPSSEPPDKSPAQTGSIERTPAPSVSAPGSSPSSANARPSAPNTSSTNGVATAHIPSTPQVMEKGSELPAKRWVVSETTSPIDYSPLVTAVLEPAQTRESGPTGLTIRCRAKRIELSLQFSGNSARNEAKLYSQVEDQPSTLLGWNWSPDGKTATFKDDPMSFLQALPDGSTLWIWTGDRARESSAFRLVGLDGIRRKVATACNWDPQQAETSSRKNRISR